MLGIILFTLFLCFLINLFVGNGLDIGIFNSFLLGVSLLLVCNTKNNLIKIPAIYIFSLALIPIFHYSQTQTAVYFLLTASVFFWLVALKLPKYKHAFLSVGFLIFFVGALISNGIISRYLKLNPEKFIWDVPETNQSIINHQKDALYVPYRLRLIFYNKSVYIYSIFTSVFGILNLRNIYDTLLLANIYPLCLGIQESYKNREKTTNKIVLGGLGLALFTLGITRSPEKLNSLFIAAPVLVFLILLGFRRVNKFVFALLFIFSMILMTSPV